MAETKFTPGPWSVGYLGTSIVCVNEKIDDEAKLFDVRGWGYFTGNGHGALGLNNDDALAVQAANACLAAAAPELYEALDKLRKALDLVDPANPFQYMQTMDLMRKCADAAIAKALGEDVR